METTAAHPPSLSCDFDIYKTDGNQIKESRRAVDRPGHRGTIFEMASPDGINFGYYNIQSSEPGKIVIKNLHPFIQLSYTLNGQKSYEISGHKRRQTSFTFKKQEYNYMLFPKEEIRLVWDPKERLEIFELRVSPELMMKHLPEDHPFFDVLQKSLSENKPALMSVSNLFIQSKSSSILYDMLNCPLEGRYKQLYVKSKVGELLALELEAYEQRANILNAGRFPRLKPSDIERMHQVRDIIISNIQSPCSLIDLAHQVGTNDAYLKKHFKEVFGATVFGYLHNIKMKEAESLLLAGRPVAEVAFLTGYKHVSHFTRAFRKHFGVNPNNARK
jgi:AraC-like DNA-binding protein